MRMMLLKVILFAALVSATAVSQAVAQVTVLGLEPAGLWDVAGEFSAFSSAGEAGQATDDCCPLVDDARYPWSNAVKQAFGFTMFQHIVRLKEKKTRQELGGPFFRDWFESASHAGGNWDDGGKMFTNYVAHPMGGAVYANIYRQNDPRRSELVPGDEGYGGMLLRAMAFSAVVSTQFELGPLSEASIGNVGLRDPKRMGWVDLVVTPTIGTAWLAGEDVIDRFLLERMDGTSVPVRSVIRLFLNPSRSAANMSRGRLPWYRSRDSAASGNRDGRTP